MTKDKIYSQSFKNIPSNEKLKMHFKKCLEAGNKLRKQIKNSEILALNIVQQKKDLNDFKKVAKLAEGYKKIIILGVGGSSLGGKTLCSLKFQEKVEFIESIDPITINNQIKKIDFRNMC